MEIEIQFCILPAPYELRQENSSSSVFKDNSVKQKLIACSILILPIHTTATETNIENITIVGSRLDNMSSSASSIFSREQIELLAPASTLDLLARIPHLQVSENGQAGGQSFVSIRGGESNFTLIMIDGISVNDPTNSRGGGFDFNQISPSAIERVEIYRGGVSAIYGGEAISGAINFITREGGENALTLSVGNKRQVISGLTLSHQFDAHNSIIFNASTQTKTESDFAQYDNDQALIKWQHNNSISKHTLLASFSDQKNVGFAEDSGGEVYALPQRAESRDSEQWIVGLNNQIDIYNDMTVHANLSWIMHQEFSNNPGIAEGVQSGVPASEIESSYKKTDLDLYATWQAKQNWNLLVGINDKRATGNNTGFVDFGFPLPVDFELEQNTTSAYAESSSVHGKYSIDLGIRFDSADNFDNETSSRISMGYEIANNIDTYIVFNEGYKLPSFFALAHPLIGNPDLKPERSKNREIGVQFQFGTRSNVNVAYFNNEFTDLVDFDAEIFKSVNRSSVDTQGIEVDASFLLRPWLNIAFDLTYTDVNVVGEDVKLRRRPKWSGAIEANANFADFNVLSYLSFNDDFYDSSIATGLVQLGGSGVLGLSGVWNVSDAFDVNVSIENALAKEYQQSVGFIVDDQTFRAGFSFTF